MPQKVSLAQAAEVTLPLLQAGAQAARAMGRASPVGNLQDRAQASPFACVLPAVGCLGRLLGFLFGENVFLLLSSNGLFSTFCSRSA